MTGYLKLHSNFKIHLTNTKIEIMAKVKKPRPNNGPSTTGNPSGGKRGNNPPKPKVKK